MGQGSSICLCPLSRRDNNACGRIDAANQLAVGTGLLQLLIPIGNRLIDICG